jgi:hypothetical protein
LVGAALHGLAEDNAAPPDRQAHRTIARAIRFQRAGSVGVPPGSMGFS